MRGGIDADIKASSRRTRATSSENGIVQSASQVEFILMNSACDTRTSRGLRGLPTNVRRLEIAKRETSYDQYVPYLLQISSLIATDASNQQQLAFSRKTLLKV